ncbi:cupin domain-containing protein [Flavobacterium rhamnosiphilum]|uniref:Cupin domain-containing protein n=1 Tax=Flavobacterium rhamnosiphilum TaxID=2541724 RepID=A0A4R5F9G3_9FLAO|nr:cupin domain-containing protein [Flavobacterium rhamnosiphilum]TDE44884.1 cupin domain-containing protein [Flavobacterium rhamnosiphilum]
MNIRTNAFYVESENPWEAVAEGVKRQITGYDVSIMMVKVAFEKGGIGPIHQHYHSQTSYVVSGKFEVTINDEKKILQAGDAFYIEPNILHGAICLEGGMLIDVFSPIREDFI